MQTDFATAFLAAFGLGLSLIVAIGAQNAFVLRQGLRREHVLAVVLTCAISDALLIVAGVAGFATLTERLPWIGPLMRYGGAAFLFVYGTLALRSAWRGGEALDQAGNGGAGLGRTLAVCLALTWGNPHVYLDTLALMGAISAQYDSRIGFAAGGVTASAVFFTTLGFGARFLAPVFRRPVAWRWLDLGIGLIMYAIAVSLLV
ncbi:L-lysine exporter, putative [Pseudooceanicola batsensis HTCC2597]|uniref:L-lysine exporter, putative n=1 Tax=Pseudooceanicola batsensis (strain ATCC BAA-863 / DSM 15984 / KCTC 12145 / HTCC2597) TaxID=252305 RepID=A3TYS1_PSEBH|nr:LysE/ArgO family amino acid transporter [Pseudooceanicola batsensis]EAQ02739.1 L-lysine exporter, putative [Pseudooceanicola batsensis HTCC2597]